MNRGARALRVRIGRNGGQQKFSKSTGIDQGYLSYLSRGVRLPGLRTRRLLETCCGIRMQWWDESERRRA